MLSMIASIQTVYWGNGLWPQTFQDRLQTRFRRSLTLSGGCSKIFENYDPGSIAGGYFSLEPITQNVNKGKRFSKGKRQNIYEAVSFNCSRSVSLLLLKNDVRTITKIDWSTQPKRMAATAHMQSTKANGR